MYSDWERYERREEKNSLCAQVAKNIIEYIIMIVVMLIRLLQKIYKYIIL